jgi:hypothetical protein
LARIFSVLAVLAVLLLAANFVAGLWIGDFNATAADKRAAQQKLVEIDRQMRIERLRSSPELDEAKAAVNEADAAFRGPRSRMTLHMMLGSAAALMAILVNSITVTYFIGTSRWCKEVCETYGIGGELAERSTRLKRGTFPWALAGILTVIGIIALGAAADPSGANWEQSAAFVSPHYLAAMLGLAVISFSYWVQFQRIAENYAIIERIMAEVRRIRAERQLPTEEWSVPA